MQIIHAKGASGLLNSRQNSTGTFSPTEELLTLAINQQDRQTCSSGDIHAVDGLGPEGVNRLGLEAVPVLGGAEARSGHTHGLATVRKMG
jgi:hypothetical protein